MWVQMSNLTRDYLYFSTPASNWYRGESETIIVNLTIIGWSFCRRQEAKCNFSEINDYPTIFQKLLEDSLAQLPVKWQIQDPSQDTPTQTTVANTISVWKDKLVNTVVQLVQSSKLAMLMVLATAKTLKMFPDGKFQSKFETCVNTKFTKENVLRSFWIQIPWIKL